MKMKKNMKWVIVGIVVVIAAALLYNALTGGVSSEILTVSKGDMNQYLEDTAQAMSRDKQTVYIEGSGKIVSINAEVGDTVKQGYILLTLEKEDLELQLKDAEAGVEAAKAQLNSTDLINYANDIELAKVAVVEAESAYELAKRNFDNSKRLYESKALSLNEYKQVETSYKAAKAVLDSANIKLSDVRKGAPEHLRNSYKAQLEQAVVYRDTVLRQIRNQEVKSPINGVVLDKFVEENSPAAPSIAAFVIGNPDDLELEAEILAEDAGKVKTGNVVEVSGKPIGDAVLKGSVTKIAPVAKTVMSSLGVNQKRVPVKIAIEDKTGLIKPGYDLDVKIITEVRKNTIKVPDSTVFDYEGESRVFVVENGRAVLRTVEKGIESGDYIEILHGLEEGETVLVKPDNSIEEGVKIKALEKNGKESVDAAQ